MRKITLILVFLTCLKIYSAPLYHNYQKKNVRVLQNTIMFGQHAFLKDLPLISYGIKGESQHEILKRREQLTESHLIDGSSDETILFYRISSVMTGINISSTSFTRNDIDTISKWWDENEALISPDFMQDLLYYYRLLSSWDFLTMHSEQQADSIRLRLQERLAYRKTKHKFCETDYMIPPEGKVLQSTNLELIMFQNKLQHIFNQKDEYNSTIESVIPRGYLRMYIYITKKLMNNEQWDFTSPITRKEFEDMMDWWFVNRCIIDDMHLSQLNSEYYSIISNM